MFTREETVGFKIRELSNLFKRQKEIMNSSYESSEVLHGIRAWTLSYIWESKNRDIFQKDIEKVFNIRRATASNMLSSLEKNGYIERIAVDKDKRLKKIVLTEKSAGMYEKMIHGIEITEKVVREGLSEDELEQFFLCINKMKNNLIQFQKGVYNAAAKNEMD